MALSGFEIAVGGITSIPVLGGLVLLGYKAFGEKNLDTSKLKPKKPAAADKKAAPAADKKAAPAADKKAGSTEEWMPSRQFLFELSMQHPLNQKTQISHYNRAKSIKTTTQVANNS